VIGVATASVTTAGFRECRANKTPMYGVDHETQSVTASGQKAGYVKEFANGDFRLGHPSLSSMA